jgi:hypothetical protein
MPDPIELLETLLGAAVAKDEGRLPPEFDLGQKAWSIVGRAQKLTELPEAVGAVEWAALKADLEEWSAALAPEAFAALKMLTGSPLPAPRNSSREQQRRLRRLAKEKAV